ncbi:YHYH protein [Hahella sp. CR1]|uniref:YHYH protein n=1 Tax=Hahella sp. CR1 TaxID=2992807 RepID=UPI0024410904|nr:YHYH protein [Hahella sp. CR1]MDG9671291.1 YHYH protein [Hahella sp. CR1]
MKNYLKTKSLSESHGAFGKAGGAGLVALCLSAGLALSGCGGSAAVSDGAAEDSSGTVVDDSSSSDSSSSSGDAFSVDITNAIFTEISGDCADYDNSLEASVTDIQRGLGFDAAVTISSDSDSCTLVSNSIPNHDFNDATAHFANNVAEVSQSFNIPRNPSSASSTTSLSQRLVNGVMLNGVILDLLSAGCYNPSSPMADADGNTAIGCPDTSDWLLDPLGTDSKFGADAHNAHTQPGGLYHYHGNPNAMFDSNPGPNGSPVIGFAADGFPIYGSYFLDPDTGTVRKAVSGYTLKTGSRGTKSTSNPGGSYDGTYIDDWEFTNTGDLDACNGMTVDGQYGYYVTDAYPWVLNCFRGAPDSSFYK